jgi:predicted nucleic acid binding AN1-type Zn finger protein
MHADTSASNRQEIKQEKTFFFQNCLLTSIPFHDIKQDLTTRITSKMSVACHSQDNQTEARN